jgi:hypothetical protein
MTSCACPNVVRGIGRVRFESFIKTAAAYPRLDDPNEQDYRSRISLVTKCDGDGRAAQKVQKIRVFISLNRAKSAIWKLLIDPREQFLPVVIRDTDFWRAFYV